jgi:hypothetical protein
VHFGQAIDRLRITPYTSARRRPLLSFERSARQNV